MTLGFSNGWMEHWSEPGMCFISSLTDMLLKKI